MWSDGLGAAVERRWTRSAERKTKEEWRDKEGGGDPPTKASWGLSGGISPRRQPPSTHTWTLPPFSQNLSPILNNSLCSHSLPPEGLVSWRHQRDDLTAPERSRFIYLFLATHQSPIHTHTHTHMPFHQIKSLPTVWSVDGARWGPSGPSRSFVYL